MMAADDEKVVIYKKQGPVAYITLNRPNKINAMNTEVYDLLESAVKDYTSDVNLRCAVISGAGGNFSSGADLKERRDKGRRQSEYGLFPAYKAINSCPKPVIAAIDGYCLASGFNCAVLYCDFRIASDRAKLGIPAVKRGLSLPYPIPYPVQMSLGNSLYMVMTGKVLSAEEALRMGIVSEVVPHEKLMERVAEIAKGICEASPLHLRAHKAFLRSFVESYTSYGQQLIELIMPSVRGSQDSEEGKDAFLEKREPKFKSK
jgi:enoyl-CoA hydratase/carnithine racemase